MGGGLGKALGSVQRDEFGKLGIWLFTGRFGSMESKPTSTKEHPHLVHGIDEYDEKCIRTVLEGNARR